MKVQNMQSSRGRDVLHQFIIQGVRTTYIGRTGEVIETPLGEVFQSYGSVIAFRGANCVLLDQGTWDYSVTTGRYRNQFLGETKKETEKKIKDGIYKLVDLNK